MQRIQGRVPVHFAALRIPVEREGELRRLSLDDATVEEIRAATRALTKREASPNSPAVEAIRKALPATLRKVVSVSVAKERVSVGRIPIEQLRECGLALSRVKLP